MFWIQGHVSETMQINGSELLPGTMRRMLERGQRWKVLDGKRVLLTMATALPRVPGGPLLDLMFDEMITLEGGTVRLIYELVP